MPASLAEDSRSDLDASLAPHCKLEIVVDGGKMSRDNFYRLTVALRPEMARFHRGTLPRMSGTIQTIKKDFSSSGF
jgi:hypothetical protein